MSNQNTPKPTKVVTPPFRLSYPALFEPKPGIEDKNKLRYGITMLFPKGTDLTPLRKALYAAIQEKWGVDKAKWPIELRDLDFKSFLSRTGKDGWPLRDGAMKEAEGYGPGVVFLAAYSDAKPGVVDQNVQPIMDKNDIYAGCWCRASVNAFAYDRKSKGVSFGLNNVQKIKDDAGFSSRSRAEDDFAPVETGEDDPNNYGGMFSEAPEGDPFE